MIAYGTVSTCSEQHHSASRPIFRASVGYGERELDIMKAGHDIGAQKYPAIIIR